MLVLIIDQSLTLAYASTDATAAFAPLQDALQSPISECSALLATDPELIRACRSVLDGMPCTPVTLYGVDGKQYLRRMDLRRITDRVPEVIVTYEPDPDLTRATLHEMRTRLATAMEAATDAYGIYDASDHLVLCNPTYANLYPGPEGPLTLGMSFDAVLRRFIAHGGIALAPEAVDTWIAKRKAERTNPYHVSEFRVPDGRFFRLIERDTLDGGRLRQMVDLTTLREAERDLHDVVIGAQVGTWSFDIAKGSLRINRLFAALLGYELADLTPFSFARWQTLMHPKDRPVFERALEAVLRGEKRRFDTELRLRNHAGEWTWCALHGGVADQRGNDDPARISGVLLDISSQQALETELIRRDAAITATGEGLCITNEKGQIVDANPALTRMLGHVTPRDLIGNHWPSLFAPEAIAHLYEFGLELLHNSGEWHGEAVMRRKDGSDLEAELRLTEMPDQSVIWICRDVTAHNKTERELLAMRDNVQRAQRQESVNLIAAGFTHDLTNLVALVSHLSDPATQGHFDKQGDVLEEIHFAARQMVALLDPIRQLGRRQSQCSEIDLGELLAEAVAILRIGAPLSLRIMTEVGDHGLKVMGDRMRLMQVLLNLGLNAREAVGDGAQSITLSLSRASAIPTGAKLETGVIPSAPFALFAIADTGPGMEHATRAKIWEPYFTTKTLSGTGLGLFVVADIVRAAGGGIALETAAGKGTTFYIAWPLDQGA
ncbi:PAS domain S-box protein [Roseicyclus sp.]|uniref:PAS domain S-box protein n=1 Tax=Roseicyclus sp. TaxID=1914329 RepID=UPI003F6B0B87